MHGYLPITTQFTFEVGSENVAVPLILKPVVVTADILQGTFVVAAPAPTETAVAVAENTLLRPGKLVMLENVTVISAWEV